MIAVTIYLRPAQRGWAGDRHAVRVAVDVGAHFAQFRGQEADAVYLFDPQLGRVV